MLKVTYRKSLLRLTHIWFYNGEKMPGGGAGDLLFFHGLEEVPSWVSNKRNEYTQKTIVKDLTATEEEIWGTLGKHLRSYIKRNAKEGIVVAFYDASAMRQDSSVLKKVAALFEKMYTDKGMKNAFNYSLAQKYIDANGLCIATVSINNEIVGFDAIVHDQKTARLWMTAFDFRNENHDSQLLSRSHQNLDWQMLMWCKQKGIMQFDFGGVNSFDNPNGIAKFKMAFNGAETEYINVIAPHTIIGQIAFLVMQLKNKLRRNK